MIVLHKNKNVDFIQMQLKMLLRMPTKFAQMMAYLIPKIHSSVDAVLPFGKMRIVIGAVTKFFKGAVFL